MSTSTVATSGPISTSLLEHHLDASELLINEIYAIASIVFVAFAIIGLFAYWIWKDRKAAKDLEKEAECTAPPKESRISWASNSTIDITSPPKAMTNDKVKAASLPN